MTNDNQIGQYETVSKYDRLRGNMKMLASNSEVALFTKPSTIQTMELLGRAETFIVATCRHHEQGDYIFLECVDETNQVIRLALPPKVANAIHSQREGLNKRRRSQAGKRRAATLTDEQKQELRGRLARARGKRGKRAKKAA